MFNLKLAITFIYKNIIQSLLIILTIVVGLSTIIFVFSLSDSLMFFINEAVFDDLFDITIASNNTYFKMDDDFLNEARAIKDVDNVFYSYGNASIYYLLDNATKQKTGIMIEPIVNYEMLDYFNYSITSGKDLEDGDQFKMIIDEEIFNDNNLKLNYPYTIQFQRVGRHDFEIIGTFKSSTSNLIIKNNDAFMYFGDEIIYNHPPSQILIKLTAEGKADELYNSKIKAVVEKYYPTEVRSVSVDSTKSQLKNLVSASQTIFLTSVQIFISIVVLLISSTLLAYFISRKTKQIGILKAMGYQNHNLIKAFLYQSIILSLFASLLGIFISNLSLNLFQKFMTDENGIMIMKILINNNIYLYSILIIFTIVTLATLSALNKMRKRPVIDLIK